jgi:hypothetical protein
VKGSPSVGGHLFFVRRAGTLLDGVSYGGFKDPPEKKSRLEWKSRPHGA